MGRAFGTEHRTLDEKHFQVVSKENPNSDIYSCIACKTRYECFIIKAHMKTLTSISKLRNQNNQNLPLQNLAVATDQCVAIVVLHLLFGAAAKKCANTAWRTSTKFRRQTYTALIV